MSDVIVHRYTKQNFRKLEKNENADCCNCMMAEKTRLIDGEDGYLCHASLYDIKTLACFVPRAEQNVWIDINDRLPEIETEKTHGDRKIKKSIRVLCACQQRSGKVLVKEGYYEMSGQSEKPYWRIPGNIDSVTHWMPLPESPTK